MACNRRQLRQRGFSLIVVFLLIIVMVGLSATVMVSTQNDLLIAGQERESATALYAAEAGIAFAKDWLTTQNIGTGSTAWTSLLNSGAVQLCVASGGAQPGVTPNALQPRVLFDQTRSALYQFCAHNNSLDPNYLLNPSRGDTDDGDGILAIESYGWGPGGSASRLTVEVRITNVPPVGSGDYAQAGGGPLKQAKGEATAIDTSQSSTF